MMQVCYRTAGSISFRRQLLCGGKPLRSQLSLLPEKNHIGILQAQTRQHKWLYDSKVSVRKSSNSSSSSIGGGGGGGSKMSGGSGTSDGNNNNGNKNKNKNKDNIDRKLLQPASNGKLLKKHESGIPKLLARKNKVHLEHQRSRPPASNILDNGDDNNIDNNEEVLFSDDDNDDISKEIARLNNKLGNNNERSLNPFSRNKRGMMGRQKKNASTYASDTNDDLLHFSQDDLDKMDYYAPSLIDDTKYFWREEEYEDQKIDDGIDLELNDDGELEVPYGKKDFQRTLQSMYDEDITDTMINNQDDDNNNNNNNNNDDGSRVRAGRKEKWETMDPEDFFFYKQNDVFELAAMDNTEFDDDGLENSKHYNIVSPLHNVGTSFDEFLQSTHEHPTKYAQIIHDNPHYGSQREPIPIYPRNRMNPSNEFIQTFVRYMYVCNLPPFKFDDDNDGDINNHVHKSLIERSIARIVGGVDTTTVYAASVTSGFVGFHSPKSLLETLEDIRSQTITSSSNPYFMKNNNNNDDDSSSDTSLILNDIPIGHTPISLSRTLFPKGSKVYEIYGELIPECFTLISNTSVLVQFQSLEQMNSILESNIVREQLKIVGQHHIQFFRARRELVHDGFDGPHKTYEKRKMGNRLVVDSDMPTKTFFISHSGVLKITNLDNTLNKYDISNAFQQYSTIPRDINGSIEYIICEGGNYTGEAYIGFDIPGDCENAINTLQGKIQIGDRISYLKLVKERSVPNRTMPKPQRRPDRTNDELMNDLQIGWEQYVSSTDIEILEKGGISKVILDEALKSIRYNNPTFGPLDYSLRTEALQPEKDNGDLYKEIVQLYVKTLIDCIATPDNVGLVYEALHFPGESIDLSIFEREHERQQTIMNSKKKESVVN